jgi:flagellar biosynthetic protein FlhB
VADDAEDKKHDPSERAMRDAGERGELPRSAELSGAVGLLAGAGVLLYGFPGVAEPIRAFAVRTLAPGELDLGATRLLLADAAQTAALAAGPVLLAVAAGAGVAGLAQTRFQVAPRAFEAHLDRLDPLATASRVYASKEPFVAMAKGLTQLGLLGGAVAWVLWDHLSDLPRIVALAPTAQLGMLGDLGVDVMSAALPAMLALAALDYGWSYWTWWQGLQRTDQQVRDEHKEQEGDPVVRAQRRRRMRELGTRKGVAAVKDATVLVTNPTHVSIALRYRHGEDAAPVVVAKGVDHLAAVLRKEAHRHGVPRVEDRRLARALYAEVKVGRAVPASLYGAVARVLAVVYRRQRRPAPPRAPAPRRRPAARRAGQ